MADPNQRTPKNVPGKFYVDNKCLAHEMCQHLAPKNFAYDKENGCFYVCKQPDTPEELAQCLEAKAACPMAAIGIGNDKMLSSEDITTLRSALARLGIFIYEYEAMREFRGGCWRLVVRKGDTMIRFYWDGRDDLLTVEEAAHIPSSSEYSWRPTDVPSVDVDETREPVRYIEEVLKKKFCV